MTFAVMIVLIHHKLNFNCELCDFVVQCVFGCPTNLNGGLDFFRRAEIRSITNMR